MHRGDIQREHCRPFMLPFAYHVNNHGTAATLEHIVTSKEVALWVMWAITNCCCIAILSIMKF